MVQIEKMSNIVVCILFLSLAYLGSESRTITRDNDVITRTLSGVFDDSPSHIEGCRGKLILSTTGSSYESISLPMHSETFQDRRRKRMHIRRRHPQTKELLTFEKVTLEGNCCWRIWDNYFGGESYDVSRAGTFQPGWRIAAVEYVEDC